MQEGIYLMSHRELKRCHVLAQVSSGRVIQRDASGLLNLSPRQIRRLLKRYKEEGPSSLVHSLRGQASKRRYPDTLIQKVLSLVQQDYAGFGPTFLSEKLKERNDLNVSREWLRGVLIRHGLWEVRGQKKRYRKWRKRKSYFGELVQMDGSHHDWLEGRGPKLVLMGYIDDATSHVFCRFYEYEGTQPAFDSFRKYVRKYGLPQGIYVDRHTTYKSNAKPTIEDELLDRVFLSQFERAMKELDVEVIHARSPQAKGRVERLFKTLQDRLIKEMRLEKISTLVQANQFLERYLPKHNQQFSVSAQEKSNLHRKIYQKSKVESALSIKTQRHLRKDRTIVHQNHWYQIFNRISANYVLFEERYDGKHFITYQGKKLRFKRIVKPKQKKPVLKGRFKSTAHPPSKNNPFIAFNFSYRDYDLLKQQAQNPHIKQLESVL